MMSIDRATLGRLNHPELQALAKVRLSIGLYQEPLTNRAHFRSTALLRIKGDQGSSSMS